MSPGKYIRLLRLEKAKKDILSGMSITQAGFDNGFETSSGFSKAFRKEYGISAREYLKQNKESEVLIMLHVEIKALTISSLVQLLSFSSVQTGLKTSKFLG